MIEFKPEATHKKALLAPITFSIAMLAGLGWCIGIVLLEQPHGVGYALTRYCLMVFVVLAPWLALKLTFCVIVSLLGRKLGLIPPARPTYSLGYEITLLVQSIGLFRWQTQPHAEKANQEKLTSHPFAHLPWAVGTMGQHLIQQALEDG